MVENGLFNRMGFSFGKRINKAKIGCIGEMAFSLMLRDKGIPFRTDMGDFSNRNSDDFDFCINGKLIDVKVAKTLLVPNDNWTYGYPVQQIGMTKDYVVVGAVNDEERVVRFYGWIPFSSISSYQKKQSNSFAGFEYSTLNYEFPWGDLNKNFETLWKLCLE